MSRPSLVRDVPSTPSHFYAPSILLTPSSLPNRRQNAHGLGPPPDRRHTLRTAVHLALQRRRRVLALLELASTADRVRDLVPARAQRRLRPRLDNQGPPRRRRARLPRAHRLALRPLTRTRRRMAPPTSPRARRASRHRWCRRRVPSLSRLAARQSRHVRSFSPSRTHLKSYPADHIIPSAVHSIGAVHRARFSLWDLSKVQGGKPALSGASFPEGAHRFRWCPTYPEYFAISTRNAGVRGATIHVHSAMHAHAHVEPTAFTLAPRPLCVRDFDFVPLKGIPRIAAAVGHELIVFPIGVE